MLFVDAETASELGPPTAASESPVQCHLVSLAELARCRADDLEDRHGSHRPEANRYAHPARRVVAVAGRLLLGSVLAQTPAVEVRHWSPVRVAPGAGGVRLVETPLPPLGPVRDVACAVRSGNGAGALPASKLLRQERI